MAMIDSHLFSIILFGTASSLILEALLRRKDLFSPIRLWTIIWCIVIGVTQLKLSYYQRDWSLITWAVIGISILSYVVGCFFSYCLFLNENKISKTKVQSEKINSSRLFWIIISLSIIFILVYVIETKVSPYGIPLFSKYPDKARREVGIFAIHLFIEAFVVIFLLTFVFILKAQGTRRRKLMLLISLLITGLLFLSLLNRLNVFIIIFVSLMVYNYLRKLISSKHMLISLLAFIIIFIGVQEIRGKTLGYVKNFIYVISKMKIPEKYAIWAGPYVYIAMNLENLDEGLSQLEQHTYGLYTFDFMLALSGLKHKLIELAPDDREFLVFSPFNTFPYMWYLYRDFGIFGVGLGSMLIGIFLSYFYMTMRISKRIMPIMIYSYLSVVVFLGFFTSMYSRLAYVFCFFLLITSISISLNYEDG